MMKTYPHKLEDGRWVIQAKQGNDFVELVVSLDRMDQVGWDSIDSLDISANVEHNHTTDKENKG